MHPIESKILTRAAMKTERERLRREGQKVVFTNGCFDIIHAGHISYLQFARHQGDVLIVGLNSDRSVKSNKGDLRPIVSEVDRATVMAALEIVNYVVIFEEKEPRDLIAELLPDVLVKAEDWAHYVSGRDVVEAHGGKVVLAPLIKGLSTTNLIKKIVDVYGPAR